MPDQEDIVGIDWDAAAVPLEGRTDVDRLRVIADFVAATGTPSRHEWVPVIRAAADEILRLRVEITTLDKSNRALARQLKAWRDHKQTETAEEASTHG